MVVKHGMTGLMWYTRGPVAQMVCEWCFDNNKALCDIPVGTTLTHVDVGYCKVCDKGFTYMSKDWQKEME